MLYFMFNTHPMWFIHSFDAYNVNSEENEWKTITSERCPNFWLVLCVYLHVYLITYILYIKKTI